jgi:soluble lytic murein transglycosylase-like protein
VPNEDIGPPADGLSAPVTETVPTTPRHRPVIDPEALLVVDQAHYEVIREQGRGGLGRIFAARDLRLDREVAIKELLIDDQGAHARRFVREATLTARLEHPGIVPVHEAGRWPDGKPFYTMKMVSGRSLRELIAERPTLAERLALLPNVIAVAETIAYAHNRRVIHRDIKPANVMVGQFGETVVIDWGLAKDLTISDSDEGAGSVDAVRDGETARGAVLGTPAYMPPEQASGEPVDERADVYALGGLLFHVLAGKPPYEGSHASDVLAQVLGGPPVPLENRVPDVASELTTIVRKAMARAPHDRYPTAKELVNDLKRFQTGQLVGAHRYTTWQLVRRYVAQHWLLVFVFAAALLVTFLGLASLVVARLQRSEATATKQAADQEIARIASAIDSGSDLESIVALEEQLRAAVGRAQQAGSVLAAMDLPHLAGPPGDEFDAHLHAALASLDSDTYSIPPSFRAEARREVANIAASRQLPQIYDRKKALWPIIVGELQALGLPETLGYIAWIESSLNVSAVGPTGTAGLWQLSPELARAYGLRVGDGVDERVDPVKSSRVAARMYADQLAQLGDDAALIAILGYNMRSERLREMLLELASTKGGWRRSGRGFWHLYHLKRMSPEAMAYVPKVLAVAIVDSHQSTYLANSAPQ